MDADYRSDGCEGSGDKSAMNEKEKWQLRESNCLFRHSSFIIHRLFPCRSNRRQRD
jgi:hypothetical protein